MNTSDFSTLVSANAEITALLVLAAGVVLARVARAAVGRLLAALDHWLARRSTSEDELITEDFTALSKRFVFWLIILATVVAALGVLGIDGLDRGLGAMLGLIPRIVIGFAIIGAGHLVGLLLRNLTASLSEDMTPDSPGPRLVHGAVLLVAVVMGLQQLAIDITFVTQLVLVLVVVIIGSMALAFALGAREFAANLIASSEMERYALGDRIRIGEIEGTIVDIHRTGADVATDEGVVAVPAAWFAQEAVTRLSEDE